MNAEELDALLHDIDVIKLVNHTGVRVEQVQGAWRGKCPFHDAGSDAAGEGATTLVVDPDLRHIACHECGFSGGEVDFVKRRFTYKSTQAFDYLRTYKAQQKIEADGYEIVTQSRHEIELRLGDRSYQITGHNLKRLNDFSFTLKLTCRDQHYIADVNLTRIKSKHDYISEVKDYLFLSEGTVRADLVVIMQAVEKMQRDYLVRQEEEQAAICKPFVLTKTEESQTLDLLSRRDVFREDLLNDLEKLGYVGDELGKKILYLAGTSRLLEKPISVLSIANSSAGKSFAQETVLSLFPDDEVLKHTRLSPKVMSHFGRQQLVHRILAIDELVGIEEEALAQVRGLLSQGRISAAFTQVDRQTGAMGAAKKEVFGPTAIFTSTTHEELIDDETRSRFLILPVDESAEQTKRVMQALIRQSTKRGMAQETEREKIRHKYRMIQKVLRPIRLIMPEDWEDQITFNHERISFKRRFAGYLYLIFSLALHRRYQRKTKYEAAGGGKMVEVAPIEVEDVREVNTIMRELFGLSFGDMTPVNEQCLNAIVRYCKEHAKDNGAEREYDEVTFSRRDIREYMGWEQTPLRRAFEVLEDMEYLVRIWGGDRSRHLYKLNVADNKSDLKLNVWNPK